MELPKGINSSGPNDTPTSPELNAMKASQVVESIDLHENKSATTAPNEVELTPMAPKAEPQGATEEKSEEKDSKQNVLLRLGTQLVVTDIQMLEVMVG